MKHTQYLVHDSLGGGHVLTSATAALVLWVVLIVSNLGWLYREGALHLPAALQRAWFTETTRGHGPMAVTRARPWASPQASLKLDAEGSF